MAIKVLLADDEEGMLEIMTRKVAAQGYEVVTAKDGQEAWDKIVSENPDVILLDITMPNIDGYEVLKKIRSDQRSAALLVVAVTANAMRGDREKILSAGFNGYVSKPISVASVRKEVDRLLLKVISSAA